MLPTHFVVEYEIALLPHGACGWAPSSAAVRTVYGRPRDEGGPVGEVWVQVALVTVLVLLNAAFAGSEMALVALREGQLQRLAGSPSGDALARLARDPNRFLATIQLGITLAGFLASASAAVSLAEPLEAPLDFLGAASGATAIVLVTLVLSYVTLVLGELAPKRLAMQRAERWGLIVARPLSAIATFARPAVWLLSHSSDVVVRLLGGDPGREREEVTEDEIRDLVAAQVSFTPQQRTIIDGAFEVAQRTIRDVLRPRRDVFTIDAVDACIEARRGLADSGHSRAPVCVGGNLDNVVGVVHLRDLLSEEPDRVAGDVAAAMPVVPETARVLETLRKMQLQRAQMVLVVNEHGGAEGIVTVEDLVEELVGEIYDETDRDVLSVTKEPDGTMLVPGRFPIHDLPDIGIELPRGDYATVAGYLLTELQRIPDQPGDTVAHGPWRFTVTAVEDRAIVEVRITRSDDDPAPPVDGFAPSR
jgi:putative hemolysin